MQKLIKKQILGEILKKSQGKFMEKVSGVVPTEFLLLDSP